MSPRILLALAAFAAGCAAAKFVIPPARAANAQRWEHLCQAAGGMSPGAIASNAQELATKAGAEGWELAGMSGATLCFKRPLL